jgi:hypothetical protein
MGLRSSAHLADEAAGGNRHLKSLVEGGSLEYLKDYMPDEKETPRPGSSKEEVALELMKFIATTTGVGKTATGAGFGGKAPKGPEEQVDSLLQLYELCRAAIEK